jgi:tetratricopeptide (TPR) repeat protein
VTARIDTPGYRLRKFVRRNLAGVAATIALIGILAGAAIFFAHREREDRRRFAEASVALQRQLLRADLEIGSPERVRDAYALANTIWRGDTEGLESRRDLAEAALKMGDATEDRNAAAKYYGEALAQFDVLVQQGGHHDPAAELALGSVASKIGAIELERGNLLAALSNFSHALRIAEGLAAMEGASEETRLNVADTNAQVGEVLLRNGARAEGVAKLKKALGIYRELGVSDRAGALEKELSEL